MSNITIWNIPDDVFSAIKKFSALKRRSINVIFHAHEPTHFHPTRLRVVKDVDKRLWRYADSPKLTSAISFIRKMLYEIRIFLIFIRCTHILCIEVQNDKCYTIDR